MKKTVKTKNRAASKSVSGKRGAGTATSYNFTKDDKVVRPTPKPANINDAVINRTPDRFFPPLWQESSGVKVAPELTVCQEADKLVYGDRERDYGSVSKNFDNIARMWSVVLGFDVTAKQVGLCMAAMKIAREVNLPKRDNLVDLAGYAATLEKLSKGL